MVTPKPGFVVKTSRADGKGDSKVFINVCTSSHLKAPAKKKQLDAEGKEQEVRGASRGMSVCVCVCVCVPCVRRALAAFPARPTLLGAKWDYH